jgi:SiaC family regulatory phosphoprotein
MEEKLYIEKTMKSPEVLFDRANGIINLTGNAILEDTIPFFEPLLQWVDNYVLEPKDTDVNIDLEYFNTSAAKIFVSMFRALAKVEQANRKLNINWIYCEDDEIIRDSGMDFSKLSRLKFNMVEKAS